MHASTNVIPIESRVDRTPALVARNRRCGPEARRRRSLLFVAGLFLVSAVLMLVDRQATERPSRPAAALSGSP
jgi:hypothetical protein